jgi:hypothetical protein
MYTIDDLNNLISYIKKQEPNLELLKVASRVCLKMITELGIKDSDILEVMQIHSAYWNLDIKEIGAQIDRDFYKRFSDTESYGFRYRSY